MPKLKKILIVISLLSLLSSCASQPIVQTVTEYADIPLQFHQVAPVPSYPVPDAEGNITAYQCLDSASELRIALCEQISRYRELLRFSTFGDVVLDLPGDEVCPYFY